MNLDTGKLRTEKGCTKVYMRLGLGIDERGVLACRLLHCPVSSRVSGPPGPSGRPKASLPFAREPSTPASQRHHETSSDGVPRHLIHDNEEGWLF